MSGLRVLPAISRGPGLRERRPRPDALLVTVVAAVIVLLDGAGLPLGPLRVVAGLLLLAYAPGAALLALLRPDALDVPARTVLAIPTSLALAAVMGVILDRTPWGVQPGTMATALLALTALLLAVGLILHGRPAGGGAVARPAAEPAARPAPVAARPPLRLPSFVRAAVAHVRDPLFLNAYALGLSGVVTSGLGVVYWAVAARLYPPAVVGVNAALISLVTLLASIAQLNLRSGFGRFVPIAGVHTERLVRAGYAAALGLALLTGLAVVGLLGAAPAALPDLKLTPLLALLFPLTVVLWTAFTVQDHALVALRRTVIVPFENGIFAVAKIVLLFPLASATAAYGILVSWTIPAAVGVATVSGWILGRLVPRRQQLAREDDAAGNDRPKVTPGEVARYVGWDYVGSLFAIGSASVLPVVVLAVLGATSSAHFYIVSTIAMATQLVPTVLVTSLFVEVASGRADFDADGGRVARQMALLLGPIVLALLLFADPILGIFGPSYAAEGATALRLLAIAGIPYALINLAFVRQRLEGRVRLVVIAQLALACLLVIPGLLALPVMGITGLGVVMLVSQTLVALVLTSTELRPVVRGALRLPGRRPVRIAGVSAPPAPPTAPHPDTP